jgi:hypothetical protein
MTIGLAFAWVITLGSLAGLLWVLTRMALHRRRVASRQEEADSRGFSLDRYQPMARLLADDDLLFLKSQPGYRPEIGACWQRERRRIVRIYLKELKSDFHRLHAQARELVAQSGADSADLVQVLMKQQMTFFRATTALEFHLVLQRIGLGKADVAPLMELIEAMRADLAQRTAPLTA